MKRLLLLLLLSPCIHAYSQLQLRVSGEYGFPLQKDFLVSYDSIGNRSVQSGSYGNGIILNFSVGKGFNNVASGYLDFSYATSKEFVNSSWSADGRTYFSNISRGTYFSIAPSLLIKAKGKKLDPYVRFGIMVAFPRVKETREYSDDPEGQNVFEFRGGATLGVMGAGGLEFYSGAGASLFVEVTTRSMVFHPKKLVNTETYDGMPPQPTANFTENPGGTELPSVSKQFTSVGLCFGVRLSLFSGQSTGNY